MDFCACTHPPETFVPFCGLGVDLIVRLQVPQVLETHRSKNGDGISMAFLVIWLFGDIANLAGFSSLREC